MKKGDVIGLLRNCASELGGVPLEDLQGKFDKFLIKYDDRINDLINQERNEGWVRWSGTIEMKLKNSEKDTL